jgi:hypothetical protein
VRLEATFRVARDVHSRKFGAELVLLDLARGEYFSLDELGARIWDELAAGHCLADVLQRLVGEYEIEHDRLEADLRALANELVKRGLLVSDDLK